MQRSCSRGLTNGFNNRNRCKKLGESETAEEGKEDNNGSSKEKELEQKKKLENEKKNFNIEMIDVKEVDEFVWKKKD